MGRRRWFRASGEIGRSAYGIQARGVHTENVATFKLGLTAAVVLGGIATGAVLAVTILLG